MFQNWAQFSRTRNLFVSSFQSRKVPCVVSCPTLCGVNTSIHPHGAQGLKWLSQTCISTSILQKGQVIGCVCVGVNFIKVTPENSYRKKSVLTLEIKCHQKSSWEKKETKLITNCQSLGMCSKIIWQDSGCSCGNVMNSQ